MKPVPVILDEALESLHVLSTFSADNLPHFEQCLFRSWALLSTLLETPAQLSPFLLSSNVFPTLELFTSNTLESERREVDFTYSDILSFITNGPGANQHRDFSSHICEIQSILADRIEENDTAIQANTYSPIASELSHFISSLERSHTIAERELTEYIARCFLYEIAYVSSLDSSAVSDIDDEVDTDKLVSAIGTYSQKPEGFAASPRHSLPFSPTEPLNFVSSDPRLNKLYNIYLQLALHKSSPGSYEEVLPYVNVMVSFYKAHARIEGFEINNSSQRDEQLLNFLCGSDIYPGIVSTPFREHAIKILTNSDELSSGVSVDSRISDDSNSSPVSETFQQTEILALVADFETVVSTLSEYDPLDNSLLLAFRTYISLVYVLFPELPTIKDFRFIDNVVNTIAAVVEYSALEDHANDTIGDILYSIREIQHTLLEISDSSTLLMRLTVSETANSTSFARSYLRKWNRQTLIASQLRIIYEEEYIPKAEKSRLGVAFRKWQRKSATFSQLSSEAESYCNKKQLSTHFNERWIKSLIRVIEMNGQVEKVTMTKFLQIWRNKLNDTHKLEVVSDAHFDGVCVAKVFRFWKSKHEYVLSLENSTELKTKKTSNLLLRNKAWGHWKSKLEESSSDELFEISLFEKLARLSQQSRMFILRKYFTLLMSRSANQKALTKFQKSRGLFLKKHFFGIWKIKKDLTNVQSVVAHDRLLSLKRSAFDCWYDQMRSRILADHTLRKTLLRTYWKQWQIKQEEADFQQSQATKKKAIHFQRWRLRYKSAGKIRKTDVKTVNSVFSAWRERTQKVWDNEEIAHSTLNRFATSAALESWRSTAATVNEMKVVADLNFQRKYFNTIWKSYSQIQSFKSTADQLAHPYSLYEKLLLKATLRKWQDAYVSKYEEEASHAVTYFQKEVRTRGTLSVFFNHWRRKHESLKSHQALLEKNLSFFNNTNILKSESLMHWIDVSRTHARAVEESEDFYRALLHKKFLLVWYEKYVTKARHLSDIADDLLNKKEFNHMVELLRKWNLKFTKNVRRNQQTCDMFVEKWERHNLKSLFELWLFKARKRATVDEYAEANATFGSNTSPLSRKFPGSTASLEYLDGASYLYTPVKKQVSRSPFTPAKTTSPTRLQETNQKMKSTKMDALTNRYKLANGERSHMARLVRSNSTSLPPPGSNINARMPRPPPAPRFDGFSNLEAGPEAVSSPEDPGLQRLNRSERSGESEDRVLETAKRLQRIKPVVIPQKSPVSEFRYSPVSKLRERLQARADSVQSPSVFE